ncbi:hypothetical protein F383_01104 [Gossypium arboreum]|uniref:Uncharacterized protein n=1 Tax=Gossypium arboreum TaxID=29729 RepID=A0A0B0PJ62_GOSAR|nr:hypothetical protein F383_01104 [Gossypium arboreum]
MKNNHLLKYYCKGDREDLGGSRAAGVDGGLKSGGDDSW